ncbi:hypothetical protein [Sorangium sp. So ce131]|uniref:hypothetical protein n=1 Tax=Sorangium sp. So ce131 TaxID=3133282 RepID=UPI003F5EFBDD
MVGCAGVQSLSIRPAIEYLLVATVTRCSLASSALLAALFLAGCNAISGVGSLTFDSGGAGGRGGAAPEAAGGGGSGGGGGDAACGVDSCEAPSGVALADQTLTELHGDTAAGAPLMDVCPDGQVILGFQGLVGNPDSFILGQIQALCGHLAVAGTDPPTITTMPGDLTPVRGDAGEVPWESICPENEVVVGFSGRAGSYLDQLTLRCAPLLVTGAPGAYAVEVGLVTLLETVGGQGGTAFDDTRCGERQVGNLVRVIAEASFIHAFGLGCKAVSLTY